MALLPSLLVNFTLPVLTALQRSPLAGFLRESVFDYYAGYLHPQLTLKRVFARVLAKRQQGKNTLAITLAPSAHWLGARAGQHLPLSVEINGVRHTRYYSPCAAAGRAGELEIAVKCSEGGLVSNWLHDQLKVGDYLEIGQSAGDFGLPKPTSKLLLLAAGSGITPILAMLRSLQLDNPGCEVVLLYYGRQRNDMAYLIELKDLFSRMPRWRLQVGLTAGSATDNAFSGRFCTAHLASLAMLQNLRAWQAIACGSYGFTNTVRQVLTDAGGVAGLQMEAFTPPVFAATADQPVTLHYARAQQSLVGDGAHTLLAQAEAHGLEPASGCRMGICNTCTCKKVAGVVRDLQTGLLSAEPNESIRLCITAPVGDVTLDL
ncbi:flavin reductase family protein [Chitinimonas sp. BJB300]|uniref:flavin reductase family protein n=1 Tax=Chitinimonas sp. BJB300 TaxID=1559339 RepID=UPI000C0D4854|nr:iron-sulfur cluster-binding domain-containing protein [Chitinimonas sp. BJB300]PHV11540.1 ferredoxin reductase [Chitinimonas sp. BJB300]TSJ87248.1 iron-sulfur cluster-binding domain-containing protein [Chitinimonas sp. BJB300]